MKISDEKIRKIIREEVGKRYTILHDKEIIKDVSQLNEVAPLVIGGFVVGWKALGAITGLGAAAAAGTSVYSNLGDMDLTQTNSEKVKIALLINDNAEQWKKIDIARKEGEMDGIEFMSDQSIGIASDKINAAVELNMRTDEDAIYAVFDGMKSRVDIMHLANYYHERWGATLYDDLEGDLNDGEMQRVFVSIVDKPLMVDVDGNRIEDIAELQTHHEEVTGDADAEREAQTVADQGSENVRYLQSVLGTRQTGFLNRNDTDALLNDLEAKYVETPGKPTKLEIATDLQARVRSLPEFIYPSHYPQRYAAGHANEGQPHPRAGEPHPRAHESAEGVHRSGQGGTTSFEKLGRRDIRDANKYWKVVGELVAGWGNEPVAESNNLRKLEDLITAAVRHQKKHSNVGLMKEAGFDIDISRFESQDEEGQEEDTTVVDTSTERAARRPNLTVVRIQEIVGAPSCDSNRGCDGIWGPLTQAKWTEYVTKNTPSGHPWDRDVSLITRSWKTGAAVASRDSEGMGGPTFAATPGGALKFLRWLKNGNFGGATAARVDPNLSDPDGGDDDGTSGTGFVAGRTSRDDEPVVRTRFNVTNVSPANSVPDDKLEAVGEAVQGWANKPGRIELELGEVYNDAGMRKIDIDAHPKDMLPRGFLGIGTRRDELRARIRRLRLPIEEVRMTVIITEV